MDATAQITKWVEEILAQDDFKRAFIVEINVHKNNRVEVFIDADDAVDFSLCRQISRQLEEKLDESLLLGEKYTLEVSSPGAGRPLTLKRQFPKHVGRSLDVKMRDGSTQSGKLLEVNDYGLVLEEEVERREGKKKIKETVRHTPAFDEMEGARVRITF